MIEWFGFGDGSFQGLLIEPQPKHAIYRLIARGAAGFSFLSPHSKMEVNSREVRVSSSFDDHDVLKLCRMLHSRSRLLAPFLRGCYTSLMCVLCVPLQVHCDDQPSPSVGGSPSPLELSGAQDRLG